MQFLGSLPSRKKDKVEKKAVVMNDSHGGVVVKA